MVSKYDKHDVKVYGGYLNDNTKILQSASGGIATALSEYMIEQGGYVVGVAYSDDFYKAEYVVIDNISDIHKLKGPKYIDCDKKNIYFEVKKLVDAGEKVLFFGLPCIVGALYSYIKARPENLLTCELICRGRTYKKVHSDYIAFLEKKNKSKIIDFSVRRKNGAWMPGYLYAKFENGRIFQKPFYETEYGVAFSILSKKPCYSCRFKGNDRKADIMIGDFWGATKEDEFWNENGVSSIFAETEKGNSFLKSTPGIALFDTTFKRAANYNPMVVLSRKKPDNSEKFEKQLLKHGLIYAVKRANGWKGFIKYTLKGIVPDKLIAAIRNVQTTKTHKIP